MNPKFSTTMTTSGLVFNQLLLDKTPVTLILDRGEKLSGQLTGWDEHYLLLVSGSKLQVVPSWRLLWLESDLEQNAIPDQNDGESEKVAAAFNGDGFKTQPETRESVIPETIPLEIAAGSIESPVGHPVVIVQDIQVSGQDADQAAPEKDNPSPLDHLEQLVKNW